MNIEQHKTRHPAERFCNGKGVCPSIAKQLAQMALVLLDHVRLKIGNLPRPFCAGKIEKKWRVYDLHFDSTQIFVHVHEVGHSMPHYLKDSPGVKNLVNFTLALESVEPVEEFDGGEPVRPQDKPVLSWPRAEVSQQSAAVP